MQPLGLLVKTLMVVFTFQTEGRCNGKFIIFYKHVVVFTFQTEGRCNTIANKLICGRLFLPFKQKADATYSKFFIFFLWLFLPFKQKADATANIAYYVLFSCFYLSNRRQMQQDANLKISKSVVFTFQTEGRCNQLRNGVWVKLVVFTFQTEGRCNHIKIYVISKELFLPFKQKADATTWVVGENVNGCFYLANSRQMQRKDCEYCKPVSCFYLANSRQMQLYFAKHFNTKGCFYLSNRKQMQPYGLN